MTTIVDIKQLDLYYSEFHALKKVDMEISESSVTAFIGPSGCGKSTLLRTLNRMNDMIKGIRIEGKVAIDGQNIYDPDVNVELLRKNIGMVFQQPNPFPKSIYDNIAYGPRIHGIKDKEQLDHIVETSLKAAALWTEVSGNLKKVGLRFIRRPAAAAVHRKSARREPAHSADGRTDVRTRSDLDAEDRRADPRASREIYDRYRHAQYAASCTDFRLHVLLPEWRSDRIRSNGENFHDADRPTDGRLYYRTFRLITTTIIRRSSGWTRGRIFIKRWKICSKNCSIWALW